MNVQEQQTLEVEESKQIVKLLKPIFEKKKTDFLKVFDGKFEVFEQRFSRS